MYFTEVELLELELIALKNKYQLIQDKNSIIGCHYLGKICKIERKISEMKK